MREGNVEVEGGIREVCKCRKCKYSFVYVFPQMLAASSSPPPSVGMSYHGFSAVTYIMGMSGQIWRVAVAENYGVLRKARY